MSCGFRGSGGGYEREPNRATSRETLPRKRGHDSSAPSTALALRPVTRVSDGDDCAAHWQGAITPIAQL